MGLNLLHKGDGRVLNLGAKNSISLQPGVSNMMYMRDCLKRVI